ncbi:hypothetical protein CC80DRAFT_126786 [Byssothecium circinans]|uniref:Secreted protein n=1 Tax=Byssothecium circinans TaxID=147558 RepID=A0A6A5TZT6_9PLEO|nr:hypothetical protein CC80DRAFT_126786 [Byssothecium circinans]
MHARSVKRLTCLLVLSWLPAAAEPELTACDLHLAQAPKCSTALAAPGTQFGSTPFSLPSCEQLRLNTWKLKYDRRAFYALALAHRGRAKRRPVKQGVPSSSTPGLRSVPVQYLVLNNTSFIHYFALRSHGSEPDPESRRM